MGIPEEIPKVSYIASRSQGHPQRRPEGLFQLSMAAKDGCFML